MSVKDAHPASHCKSTNRSVSSSITDSCLIMSGEAYNVNKNVKLGIVFLVCPTSREGKNNFLDASEMKRVSTTLKLVNSRC